MADTEMKKFTVRLDEADYIQLDDQAKKLGVLTSVLHRFIVKDWLAKVDRRNERIEKMLDEIKLLLDDNAALSAAALMTSALSIVGTGALTETQRDDLKELIIRAFKYGENVRASLAEGGYD